MSTKKKIAILGGGIASLTAAYELTDQEGWEDLYEVTLYQMGWLLGGKCATKRGPNGRIEEHGIHVFLGFYNNVFRMMQSAYAEMKEKNLNPESPFKDWTDAFRQQNSILIPEYLPWKKKWDNWPIVLPTNELVPGIGGTPSQWVRTKDMIKFMLELILGDPFEAKNQRGCLGIFAPWLQGLLIDKADIITKTSPSEEKHYEKQRNSPHWWDALDKEGQKLYGHLKLADHTRHLHHARKIAEELPENEEQARKLHKSEEPHPHSKIRHLLENFVVGIENRIEEDLERNDRLRRLWLMMQLAYVAFKGLEEILQPDGTYDFDSINHLDFREWLSGLGAHESVVWSAPVKDIYTLIFAYPDGDSSIPGKVAAGTAILGGMLLVLGYKGSPLWKFSAGTASTVISPLYDVLKSRGVKFEFFNKVEQVHFSDTEEIEKITVGKQVDLSVPEYQPLIRPRIKGLDGWPEEPLYDQINAEQAAQLQKDKINLNSNWSTWKNVETKVLEKGKDFDQIILGISIAALKSICREIIEKKPKWKAMVKNVATVQTQGVQLWLNKTNEEMGMKNEEWGIPPGERAITDTYINPINSWVDMTDLIPLEDWPADNIPKNVTYYCGPMRDAPNIEELLANPEQYPNFPAEADQKVREMAAQWLNDNTNFFWPDATTKESPTALNLQLLVDPSNPHNTNGWDKLQKQFFRANIDPSERYVLSLPGSAKFRLKTDESGFKNLFLTGDWIDTGYNMGCVEVTAMSGLMAAQAVMRTYGITDFKPIIKDF